MQVFFNYLAEAVRFELTEGYKPSTVFKTVALNRSATLPSLKMRILAKFGRFAKCFLCVCLSSRLPEKQAFHFICFVPGARIPIRFRWRRRR